MYFISSLSGGVSSAVATDRAIQRYGRDRVAIWFADTKWEDPDLYRFVDDCMKRWGGKLVYYADGRTPPEVAEDLKIIPNQKIAPCSRILKQEPFERWLWKVPKSVTVLLGLGWDEYERIEQRQYWHKKDGKWRRPVGYQARIPGVYEDYPLMWKPFDFDPFQTVRSWGIEIPELYKLGAPHNNCGLRCWRQGLGEWLRLKANRPSDFAWVRDWEQRQRAKGGARANYAIARDQSNKTVKPLTLAELEKRNEQPGEAGKQEDLFSCMCGY